MTPWSLVTVVADSEPFVAARMGDGSLREVPALKRWTSLTELVDGWPAAADGQHPGTVDATPLFLCLLTEHADWSGDLALSPLTSWAPELNLTPMLRAAAGLGADVVRAEQEALVTAAQTQLDAFKQEQREGRRRQLATAFVNRVKRRIANASPAERARISAPLAPNTAQFQVSASPLGIPCTTQELGDRHRVAGNPW